MREENIKQALNFLLKNEDKDGKMQSIPLEEKKRFLEGKLTEEEIGEVMKRYNQALANPGKPTTPGKGKDSVLQNVHNSPQAEQRLQHQSSIIGSPSVVASIAVLSSFAVNYMLEKFKDVRDKNLREELKDRFEQAMRESQQRIRALEAEADTLRAKQIVKEDIDKLITERFEQFENGQVVGEAKSRALTLKLRSQQVAQEQQQQPSMSKEDFLKIDLTEEQKEDLKAKLSKLIIDCEDQAGEVLKRLKVPIQNSASKKHFELNSGMFKSFYDKRGGVVKEFLDEVGFTGLTATKYIFQKTAQSIPVEGDEAKAYAGNFRVIEYLIKIFEEEIAKLPK
ncbi:hypothetical protein FGO68_gene5654 [Halteria grandinella]|uniref:Uncharacterized protein n=1 Tax=Halteria grandinella TaxID=5974 RepID=A0A8J8T1U4_HALGN|nr:hypothetical protein FGO68_gene5654 [Halteria grandinella]